METIAHRGHAILQLRNTREQEEKTRVWIQFLIQGNDSAPFIDPVCAAYQY